MSKAKKKTSRANGKTATRAKQPATAQEAFEKLLPEAKALPKRDVMPFRADADLALHNVQLGTDAVLAQRARIAKELPALDLASIERLPTLALAVVFASGRVDPKARPKSEVRADLKRAHELRAVMLSAAESTALAGLVPAREVAKIREGRGASDVAKDCVDLAALFTKYPAAAKKTVVTAEQIREAAELGSALVATLIPSSAKRDRSATPAQKQAADERDRLWTLLAHGHEELWRAGAWLFGRKLVEERVPSLQSRAKSKPKPTKTAKAATDAVASA